jgi:hypothetical protein
MIDVDYSSSEVASAYEQQDQVLPTNIEELLAWSNGHLDGAIGLAPSHPESLHYMNGYRYGLSEYEQREWQKTLLAMEKEEREDSRHLAWAEF